MSALMSWWASILLLGAQHTFLALLAGGLLGGIFAVILGGGMFFYTPFLQVLFPSVSFGAIVGNIKVGSFFRGIGSTYTTRKLIEFRKTFMTSLYALAGTIIGASLIANLDQRWLFPVTILAIAVAEAAPWIARHITSRTFGIASFVTGIYAGFLGAGIGILLVALFRLKHPEDKDVAVVKIQARFSEFLLGITAVVVHWLHGNLHANIWVPWSLGAFAGGIIGGLLLQRISGFSGKIQKVVLRISFALAFIVSAWAFVR